VITSTESEVKDLIISILEEIEGEEVSIKHRGNEHRQHVEHQIDSQAVIVALISQYQEYGTRLKGDFFLSRVLTELRTCKANIAKEIIRKAIAVVSRAPKEEGMSSRNHILADAKKELMALLSDVRLVIAA